MTNGIGDYNCRVSLVSVVTGATAAADQSLTAERDPAIAFSEATGNTKVTAAGAVETVIQSAESSVADDPYEHVKCLIDGLPNDLSAEQHARATAFIQSRASVFSRSEYDIGQTRIIPHRIDTGDNAPHFEQLRRHPTTQLPMIDEHVEHMLAHDVIEPAALPWSSNVVMV